MRVTITVAADPRPEAQRSGIHRQPTADARAKRTIEHPREARDRIPETLLEDDETTANFVDRRRTLLADFVGRPCALDLTAKRRQQLFAFDEREIRPVAVGQRARDPIVLLNDAPA